MSTKAGGVNRRAAISEAEVHELYVLHGLTIAEIAVRLALAEMTIRRRLRDLGIRARPRGNVPIVQSRGGLAIVSNDVDLLDLIPTPTRSAR